MLSLIGCGVAVLVFANSVSGIDEEEPTDDGTRRSVLFNLDAPDTVTVYLYANRN